MSTAFAPIYTAFRKANIPEAEAVAAADAMTEAFGNAAEQQAIKADILEMKRDIATLKTALAEAKLEIIKWVIAIGFIQAGFVVGLLKFTS